MEKEIIKSDKAPKPVGPYSQAVKAGNFLFVSGQIAIDPKTGTIVPVDIKGQTIRILENIKAILEAAGLTMNHVVRVGVFLKSMADFSKMNDVYATYFKNKPPARTTVQAGNLPPGAEAEIDVIAHLGD